MLSFLFRNLRFTRTNTRFREWEDQRVLKIRTTEPDGLFKGEDIGVDVQELTEALKT